MTSSSASRGGHVVAPQVSTMALDGGEGSDTTAQSSETYVYDGDR